MIPRPRHPIYFLAALVAATLLWYSLTGTRRASISVSSTKANLTLEHMPRDLVLAGSVPDTVTLRLRGPQATIADNFPILKVSLDLSEARPGPASYPVDVSDVRLPQNVEILAVEPAEIEISLERLQIRNLVVEPVISGQPAAGFQVLQVIVDPPRLTVQGPESRVAQMTDIRTTSVLIEGSRGSLDANVEPVLADPAIRLLTIAPVTVRVEIVPVAEPEMLAEEPTQ